MLPVSKTLAARYGDGKVPRGQRVSLFAASRLMLFHDKQAPNGPARGRSPCTFFAVPSHRLFESSWPKAAPIKKSLDALSTSPQAGFLNRS
jgi:hypothetical protein